MSLNTSHTPDGGGVLLYNGEVILIYSKEVSLEFDGLDPVFEGRKNGPLYLTSHRVIFTNNDSNDRLLSFSIPFQSLREVKVRHPLVGATYLKGQVLAQPNGNWIGDAMFKLTFYVGSCIEFGEALLKATKLATQHHHALYEPPPPYAPPPSNYVRAPPASYTGHDQDYGLNIPTNAFPDQPAAGTVYMYEAPPPYAGIPLPQQHPQQQPSYPNQPPQTAADAYGQQQNGSLENDKISTTSDTMDDEPNLDDAPPTKRMKISPPIHQLPNEVFIKIIDKLPRTQWPDLELIDKKFRDAVRLLAWGPLFEVDIERDFIYSETEAIKDENDHDPEMVRGRLRLQIARQTEAVLKKLSERSPFITSLSGLSLIVAEPTLHTTAVQYLSKFEHLETIKFTVKYVSGRIVNGPEFDFFYDMTLINFIEFIESTKSRATWKDIDIKRCRMHNNSPMMSANCDQRLRAAFANDPNDPTRQLLQLESVSMRIFYTDLLTFVDAIDTSRMTQLSLGCTSIEPAALTNLISGAPRLQLIDFAFLRSCQVYDSSPICQGGRLQPNKQLLAALESHPSLTSLGINYRIWDEDDCVCHRFEEEFKKMLRTIAPQLTNFVFIPYFLPPDIRMGEIRNIIQNRMPSLKSITLDECCANNPEELRGIADGKELEEIEMEPSCLYADDDHYMSSLNEVFSTIIIKSSGLKKFNGVNYNLKQRYNPDQRVVAELCKLFDLVDLRIRADRLTKENFIAFSQVFAEKLEVLHLIRIKEGAEPGLIKLIGKATQLRELIVERNVTDRLLECLAESCPNLEKFRVQSVDGITFGGLQMLVDHCLKLRWLDVENTDLASSLKNLALDRYRKLETGNWLGLD